MSSFVGKVGKAIFTPVRKVAIVGRRNSKFVNSVFSDCSKSKRAFFNTRKQARNNGAGHVTSIGKGLKNFVRKTGPIPFATSACGFFCLPIGGTSIGLFGGTLVKQLFKKVGRLFF